MDYKKKYEESLERARVWKEKSGMPIDRQGILDDIFPELKESEDERIRKAIIAYMRYERKSTEEEIESRFIPWLEKQGEQKANEIHPIFRVGDYIRNKKTSDKVLIEQLNVESEVYYYTSYDGAAVIHSDFPFSRQDEWELIGQKIVEQKYAWSEEDESLLQEITNDIKIAYERAYIEQLKDIYSKQINWLKSIKERMKGK